MGASLHHRRAESVNISASARNGTKKQCRCVALETNSHLAYLPQCLFHTSRMRGTRFPRQRHLCACCHGGTQVERLQSYCAHKAC